MAGGAVIKDDVKKDVAEIQWQHPDWPAKTVRAKVFKKFGECRTPKLRAIQKLMAKGREHGRLTGFRKLGQEWHLGTLNEFPISAEAARSVLEVQKVIRSLEVELELPPESWPEPLRSLPAERVVSFLASVKTIFLRPVSIRHALWIDHLHAAVNDPLLLWIVSVAYSFYEDICDLAGTTDVDTRALDEKLRQGDYQGIFMALTPQASYNEGTLELIRAFVHAGAEMDASEETE